MKLTTIFVAFPLLSHAFLPLQQSSRHATERYLDPKIADMIDNELHRLHHKKDFEREWMEKNRQAVVASFENPLPEPVVDTDFRQRRKDESLARKDPARYCADRCVSTGNCDVYEDLYVYSILYLCVTDTHSFIALNSPRNKSSTFATTASSPRMRSPVRFRTHSLIIQMGVTTHN